MKKHTKNRQQAILSYCDEVVKLLHLSYDEINPLRERVVENFKLMLPRRFSPYGFWKFEETLFEEIPWNDVFKNIISYIYDYIRAIIQNEKDNQKKTREYSNDKTAIDRYFDKRTKSLKDLKEKN